MSFRSICFYLVDAILTVIPGYILLLDFTSFFNDRGFDRDFDINF